MLWLTLGLMTLVQGEQFRLLTLNFAGYPQLALLSTYLFALFAIVQGYWFAKQKGFVPYIGFIFFLFLTIYLGSSVTQRIQQQPESADWITLFLLILTILSLLGCRKNSTQVKLNN
jgi:quinol-cytochrome oxidoreductase complex cytochrome b subunit